MEISSAGENSRMERYRWTEDYSEEFTHNTEHRDKKKKINNLKEMDWKLRSSKICLIGIMKEEKKIAEK